MKRRGIKYLKEKVEIRKNSEIPHTSLGATSLSCGFFPGSLPSTPKSAGGAASIGTITGNTDMRYHE